LTFTLAKRFREDRAFQAFEAICRIGPRIAGSPSESIAAALVKNHFEESNLSSIKQDAYALDYFDGRSAKVESPDGRIKIEGIPCWMSASTEKNGIIATTSYLGDRDSTLRVSAEQVEGKIVFILLQDQFQEETLTAWKSLYSKKPAGVVFLDIQRDESPRAYAGRGVEQIFSQLPSMVTSAAKAKSFHDGMHGSVARLVVEGSIEEGTMYNVSGRVDGNVAKTILICAHHDTHAFTEGATDNAAGVSIVLGLARLVSQLKPHFTYQFVTFGGEESSMIGSKYYVQHNDTSDVSLCINLDSIGALPGQLLALTAGSDEMIDWVSDVANANPYPARCRRVATSGGDNIVFAAKGIPTIHLASMGTTSGKVSHSAVDSSSLLISRDLAEVGRLGCRIIETIELCAEMPFTLSVPKDLQKQAREYLEAGHH
jgi:Iap family predicted aminopeptidase